MGMSHRTSGVWAKGAATKPAAYHPVDIDAMEQPPVNGHTSGIELERRGKLRP